MERCDDQTTPGNTRNEDRTWIVYKFGGTSVASAQAIESVRDIVMSQVQM